jgi:hypothetical protein
MAAGLRPRLATEAVRLRHLRGYVLASYGSRMLVMEVGRKGLSGACSCEPDSRLK